MSYAALSIILSTILHILPISFRNETIWRRIDEVGKSYSYKSNEDFYGKTLELFINGTLRNITREPMTRNKYTNATVFLTENGSARSPGGYYNNAIMPQQYESLYDGNDATAAFQKAVDVALKTNKPMYCTGDYFVTKIVVEHAGLKMRGDCRLIGISAKRESSVFELRAGAISIDGSLEVSANYRNNYDSALWWNTNSQGSNIRNVSATQAKVCYKIGSYENPTARLSELTIFGGRTYGCTQAANIIGTETYIQIIGAQWSADAFGAPSDDWAGIPFRGILAAGADVTFSGGELIMTTVVSGSIIEASPLSRSNGVHAQWPRIRLIGTVIETASPIALTTNSASLNINPSSGVRGLLSFINVSGFHSQDASPMIVTSSDYDGEIIWHASRMWHQNKPRSQPNILAGSIQTDVWVDDLGFGVGFRPPLSGTVNGIAHHSLRQVLHASSIAYKLRAKGQRLVYNDIDLSGDAGRYTECYNKNTGAFTVPPGGLAEAEISVSFQSSKAQGTISIFQNESRVVSAPIIDGSGYVKVTRGNLKSGTTFSAFVELQAAPVEPQKKSGNNYMTISARN
ncbi:MAG: hypothetical protein MIN69_04870 [Methylorubrum extorquens]|jgi:hypothetical protein|uniref:hypothetical protein n=1 Tax=Methylorubrum extorquens TaxID=408 RepID=UPI002FEE2899